MGEEGSAGGRSGSSGDDVARLRRRLEEVLERNRDLGVAVRRAEEELALQRAGVDEQVVAVWEAVPRKFWGSSLPASVRAAVGAGACDGWREPYEVLSGAVAAAWEAVPDEFIPDDDHDHRLADVVAAMADALSRQGAGDEVHRQFASAWAAVPDEFRAGEGTTLPDAVAELAGAYRRVCAGCAAGHAALPHGAGDAARGGVAERASRVRAVSRDVQVGASGRGDAGEGWRRADRLLSALADTLDEATWLCAEAGEVCSSDGFGERYGAESFGVADPVSCGVVRHGGGVPGESQEVAAMAAEVEHLRAVVASAADAYAADAEKYAAAWGALPEPYDAANTLPEAVAAMAAELHALDAEVTELRLLRAAGCGQPEDGGEAAALRRENERLRSALLDAQAGVARLRAERGRLADDVPPLRRQGW